MNGSTVLHFAAESGNEQLVRWLLDQPQAHQWEKEGLYGLPWETALYWGHVEIATVILESQQEHAISSNFIMMMAEAFDHGSHAVETQ